MNDFRDLLTHPHRIELAVLTAVAIGLLIWIEVKKPSAWLQWLLLSVLFCPALLFLFDDQGRGFDTSALGLGLALGLGVVASGFVTLRSVLRRRSLVAVQEKIALEQQRHGRQPLTDLDAKGPFSS
jgi:hypothetical protein